jgi:2-octaprenyl-6-methoxyphenol hydroxylase
MAAATDAVNALFSNDDPVLRGLRRLGLGAVDAVPGLKRRFVREAAGLAGDLPELMR